MRVYLPATLSRLRDLIDRGALGPAPLTAFGVTEGVRRWYADEDVDSLEYAALLEAARASLRLLDADPAAERRRVVVAAEVPDASVSARDDIDRGVVHLNANIPMSQIASVHVDDPDAVEAVGRAATAVLAADLGDEAAQELVDDAEGFELSWYASQEIEALLEVG